MITQVENSCDGCGQIFLLKKEGECFDCSEQRRLDLIEMQTEEKQIEYETCDHCNGTGEVECEN